MVYGLPRLLRSLAMTKGAKDNDFFFFFVFVFVVSGCGLLRRFTPRNDEESKRQHPYTIIARIAFAIRGNLIILGSSLRGFEKAVAISV